MVIRMQDSSVIRCGIRIFLEPGSKGVEAQMAIAYAKDRQVERFIFLSYNILVDEAKR